MPPRSRDAEIPVLETPRLRLRAHTAADYPASCALWSHPEVIRFTLGKPATREEVWSRMLRYLGSWAFLGYGYWVVEERETRAFVGEVGLCNLQRDLTPPLGDVPEIGWSLSPAHQSKGYATEAARAALEWATAPPLSAPKVACIVHAENTGSLRVAEKLGFVRSHTTMYRGAPTLVLFSTSPAPSTCGQSSAGPP
jgi:RimJ/RimL family protein N-acetyltransferase